MFGGQFFCGIPMIQPRRWSTIESGELNSLLETEPVFSQNTCAALKTSDPEIRSAARRRVRKSRGEQATVRHDNTPSKIVVLVRMKGGQCRVRILRVFRFPMKISITWSLRKGNKTKDC
jgi:hypothetical protein